MSKKNKKENEKILQLKLSIEDARGLLACLIKTSAKGKELTIGMKIEDKLTLFLLITH